MQYLGGKFRLAGRIAEEVGRLRRGRPYLEPFVGAANVVAKIDGGTRMASDANQALVTMWQALQRGWEPPDVLSRTEWEKLRASQDPEDPMTAFAGFGCSFCGMWFAGYADRAGTAKRSLARKMRTLGDVLFVCRDYRSFSPANAIVYCDPPYAGTTGYDAVPGGFNHAEFWETLRGWSRQGTTVLVSEYSAPDWVPVLREWSRTVPMSARNGAGAREKTKTERLYILEDA